MPAVRLRALPCCHTRVALFWHAAPGQFSEHDLLQTGRAVVDSGRERNGLPKRLLSTTCKLQCNGSWLVLQPDYQYHAGLLICIKGNDSSSVSWPGQGLKSADGR